MEEEEEVLTPGCEICEQPTDLSNIPDIIVLRVGSRKISQKHGRPYFHPEDFDDREEERYFHLHCLCAIGFDFSDAEDYRTSTRCVFCNHHLLDDAFHYELELGRFFIDSNAELDWKMARERGRACRTYACHDCVFSSMSEGHENTGRSRLGMELVEEAREIDFSALREGWDDSDSG